MSVWQFSSKLTVAVYGWQWIPPFIVLYTFCTVAAQTTHVPYIFRFLHLDCSVCASLHAVFYCTECIIVQTSQKCLHVQVCAVYRKKVWNNIKWETERDLSHVYSYIFHTIFSLPNHTIYLHYVHHLKLTSLSLGLGSKLYNIIQEMRCTHPV